MQFNRNKAAGIFLLMLALSLSGTAGLINQVVWQRGLKVFLGGSETISSTIVVLVFMAGLGVGSIWIGRRMVHIASPVKALTLVELLLSAANFSICYALGLDITESIYLFQRTAVLVGIPLRALYALSAIILLGVPCFLMGTTLPLAAGLCQKELQLAEGRFVNKLYFFNTLGAMVGALLGTGTLLPTLGQHLTLVTSAVLNLAAAVVLLGIIYLRQLDSNALKIEFRVSSYSSIVQRDRRSAAFAILAFGFGFSALWYEMLLYRAVALRYQPLPLVFSAVLSGFLLFWSLGVYVSSLRLRARNLSYALFLCVLSVAGALGFYGLDDSTFLLNTVWNVATFLFVKGPYFIPCFFFGLLFGLTLQRTIGLWGRDVGWFNAWNTAGSCFGIVLATFIGYELDLLWMVALLGLLLLSLSGVTGKLAAAASASVPEPSLRYKWTHWLANVPTLVFGLAAIALAISGFQAGSLASKDNSAAFFGRDGVIFIDKEGNLIWDGLWHSRLSSGTSHIGTYNWSLAIDPVLAHPTGDIKDALVVGVGSGVTVATLAKLRSISEVDAYDINQTLKRVLKRYPEGTLRIAENPKINIIWQDGRSGLALHAKRYDLITQQPLHLKQAGASILLSKEYFRLVAGRLKKNGVFSVYANGTPEQALVVRQTAFEVFPHRLVLHNGYELILSNDPLDCFPTRIESLLPQDDQILEEIRLFRERIGRENWAKYTRSYNLPLADSRIVIRDDFPLVEYPKHLTEFLKSISFDVELPEPGFEWKREASHF